MELNSDWVSGSKKAIHTLVNDFKAWSKTVKQHLEWEVNYSDWSTINTAFKQLLNSSDFREWDQELINDVLYLIARDNECESLIRILHDFPECLLFLAKHGLNYPESDARWQLAYHGAELYNSFPE